MASYDKSAVLKCVLLVFILPIGVFSACDPSKTVTEYNDMAYYSDAVLLGTATEKVKGPDSAFPDQDKSFGFKFSTACIYQNKERKAVSLPKDSVIYGGGSRDDGTRCHNISLPMNKPRVIFVQVQDDGKVVALYSSLGDEMVEEINIYCFLEDKATSDNPTGQIDEDVCSPVLTKPDCTDYAGSNSGIVITEKPRPRPTTKKPTAEPGPTTKKPEGTTKKTDPGYTVKNGKPEPEPNPNPGTKGGQTVDDSGNGSTLTSLSYVTLGLLFCISLVLF